MTSITKCAVRIYFLLLIPVISWSQDEEATTKGAKEVKATVSVEESTRNMSLGNANAITIRLLHQDAKSAEKLLETFLKNHMGSRSKKVKKSNEKLSEDVMLSSISSDPVDVYHEVVEMGEGSVVYMWVDIGGTILSSENNPDVFAGMSEVVAGYQKDIKVSNIEDELEEESKKIADLEKEHKKQIKQVEKWKKEIQDCKTTISQYEASIPNEEKEVSAMQKKVDEQESAFKSASTDVSKKAEKKELKSLERQLRRLSNTLKGHKKEIKDCKRTISENENAIQNAESNIEALMKNLEDHQREAAEIENRLNKAKA